jgi:hypothetical protein
LTGVELLPGREARCRSSFARRSGSSHLIGWTGVDPISASGEPVTPSMENDSAVSMTMQRACWSPSPTSVSAKPIEIRLVRSGDAPIG